MNGRAFVFTGVRQPFEAREFPLPEVEPDGILVRVRLGGGLRPPSETSPQESLRRQSRRSNGGRSDARRNP